MIADIGHNTMVLWIWLGLFGLLAVGEIAYASAQKKCCCEDEDDED